MEIVKVIGAPRTSFNRHRRMSDLVRTQVQHFKQVAHTLDAEAHKELPHHAVLTEHDAAMFIHAMTKLMRRKKVKAMPARRKKTAQEETVFALAAEAEVEKKSRGKKKKGKTKVEKKRKKKEKKLKKRETAAKERDSAAKKATKKKSGPSKKATSRSKR